MSTREELESVDLAPGARAEAAARCTATFDFAILGGRVRLRTNVPDVLGGFLRTYATFAQPTDSAAPADLEIVAVRPPGAGPELLFLARDRAYRTAYPRLVADPEPVIEYLAVTHNRSHYLVHAGCVSRAGRGLAIAGASRMGKTTLTAFLVARGFRYLSDEVAPVSRADGTLSPYPLALGIRAGPASALVADLPYTEFVSETDRKAMVNACDFTPAIAQAPVPLHAVVFLTNRVAPDVRTPHRFDGKASVWFNAMNPAFRAAVLERTGSERLAERSIGDQVHVLTLRSRAPDGFLDALRAVARTHGIGIVWMQVEDLDPADFDAAPRLLRLPIAVGLVELIKKLPSSQKAELVRTQFGGRMTGLVGELARRVGHAAFYKLSPGRLEAMVETLERLA